jgi:hypothetical protein
VWLCSMVERLADLLVEKVILDSVFLYVQEL